MDREELDKIRWKRSDLSYYLVHLTKECDRGTAYECLDSILKPDSNGNCFIYGGNHGFFRAVGNVQNKNVLKAVCFTEAPLDQIKHFDKPMGVDSGRDYSNFGLVFEQNFIRHNRGNPCFYINTLGGSELKNAIASLADVCQYCNNLITQGTYSTQFNPIEVRDNINLIIPYFNVYGPSGKQRNIELDYYWEREWRVPGDLKFTHDDVFCGLSDCVLLDQFQADYPDIPFICPEWNNDKILKKLRDWKP